MPDEICDESLVRLTYRGEHRPRQWRGVTRGVSCHVEADPWITTLRAWATVLPAETQWTHLTGAAIRGWWLPPTPKQLPLFAAVPHEKRPRRRGLRAIRRRSLGKPDLIAGLQVESAIAIIIACAADLGELDLACLVASALAAGDCTVAELTEAASVRRRGMLRLRRVLARTAASFESPWEVMLAELHHACGIPVQPQYEVYNERTGEFAARGDLWLIGTRRLHEYDGDHHLDRQQHRSDLRRDARIDSAGWSKRGYTKNDVLQTAVRILADADEAVGRPHQPERIRGWHDLLRASLHTAAGAAAMVRRFSIADEAAPQTA